MTTQTQGPKDKSEHRLCVLGNYSGRNAGDMAILGCLIQDIASHYPNTRFVIPTINPSFVKDSFPEYSVEPVSLLPWALSIKIFGLPVFRAVLSADVVLVTDNILFDRKLFNPLFNYLSTLALVLPLAKRRGIPVVLYNMSLGPISTSAGKWCFERVIRSAELIILRDTPSRDLIDKLQIPHGPIEIRADCALNTRTCSPERLQTIISREGLFRNPRGTIAFNVNTYLDVYLRKDGSITDPEYFTGIIARTIDRVVEEMGLDVLFFVTQVMDLKVTERIVQKIRHGDHVQIVSNKEYDYEELATLMQETDLMVGLRTHALILASSVGVPVIGIISYPKTAGYLASIQQNKWAIRFEGLNTDHLFSLIQDAHRQRFEIRRVLEPAIRREKQKAKQSVTLLSPFLNGSGSGLQLQTAQGKEGHLE